MAHSMLEMLRKFVGRRASEVSPSPFGRWLDGVLVEVDADSAVVEFTVREDMTNTLGILHGGAAAGILDDLLGMLGVIAGGGREFVSVNLSVNFLSSAKVGDTVTARGRIVRRGSTVVAAEGTLDRDGKLLATATTNLVARPERSA